MKKVMLVLLGSLFIFTLFACRDEVESPSNDNGNNHYDDTPISLADPSLETAIRDALGHLDGPLTHQEASQLERLDARGLDIVSLQGIEVFSQLKHLDLRDNQIGDLGPLASLVNMQTLDVSRNPLKHDDLDMLRDMTALEHLNVRDTRITRLDVLTWMPELTYLNIHSNRRIESLAPIAHLHALETLIARHVPVADDIIYLQDLTNLIRLNLRNTFIQDVSVLANLMSQGALQDDPLRERYADVDLRDNPIPWARTDTDAGYNLLSPYWENIRDSEPTLLPTLPAREHPIYINEFVSSNGEGLQDEDDSTEDWIELYNPNSTPYSLEGHFLSDDPDNQTRWAFPAHATIPARGYLIVFASGKDRTEPNQPLHTNFRIDAFGEALTLTAPDGTTRIDHVPAILVPRNMSFGRQPDGGDAWHYFPLSATTPGRSNNHATTWVMPRNFYPTEPPEGNTESFDRLFNDAQAKSFTVIISQSEWDALDATMRSYHQQFNDWRTSVYARADLLYEDEDGQVVIENIGFRSRGNLSRVRLQNDDGRLNLSHFKFSFDEDFDDPLFSKLRQRTVFELGTLDLKFNRNRDATYITEKFALDLFNDFDVMAARTTLANVYVQIGDETHYYGLYTAFEPIDDLFIERRFEEEAQTGNLYKSLWQQFGPASLQPITDSRAIGIKDTSIHYRPAYDLKTNRNLRDHSELLALIDNLNTLQGDALETYVRTHIEIDALLRLYAAGVLIGNVDDYRAMANNYYLYHNPLTHKWHMIPFDYDHGLGQGWQGEPVFNNHTIGADIINWGRVTEHLLGRDHYAHPLADRILAIPSFKAQYLDYVETLLNPANNLFTFERFETLYLSQKALYGDLVGDSMTSLDFGLRNTSWYFSEKRADVLRQLQTLRP